MIIHIFNSSVISGPETLAIPALAQLGEEFRVILLRENRVGLEKNKSVEAFLDSLHVTWSAVDVRSRWDRQATRDLAQTLREANCQIVHAHDVKASTYLLSAARQIPDRPFSIVTTHHGISARPGLKPRAYELFYSFLVASKFDRLLAVCTADYSRLMQRGLNKNQVRLHLNGATRPLVEQGSRLQTQAQIRTRWSKIAGTSFDSDTILIGIVARLAPGKQHELILEVAKCLQDLLPTAQKNKYKFLFFGSGSLEQKLKAETSRLGLGPSVVWMGYDSQVGQETAGFDVLLSLSAAEGLPINLIEAGWAGTPVFAMGVDGVLDLIDSPEVGRLVPVGASASEIARALYEFLLDQDQLRTVGLNFQKRVRSQFSSEVWLKRLLEIYSELPHRRAMLNPIVDCEM